MSSKKQKQKQEKEKEVEEQAQICDFCLKKGEKLLKCGGCGFVAYCSTGCQKSHWGDQRNVQAEAEGEEGARGERGSAEQWQWVGRHRHGVSSQRSDAAASAAAI